MKKFIFTIALTLSAVIGANAKTYSDSIQSNYRRSSLCQFMVSRTDQNMYDRIQKQYMEIPTPNQYYDHNLSIRMVNVDKKGKYEADIDKWLADNDIASRLVAKWYDRDILTGKFSTELIKARGLYNATEFDKELAARSARGKALLEDAGEELIGNTFVLVHQVHYIDNAKRSKNVATGLRVFGALTAIAGFDLSDSFDAFADMAQTFKGFRVKFHTRLYRLVWTPEIQYEFFTDMYGANKDVFEQNRGKFTLEYVGEVESSGSQNSFLGISEENPDLMIRKACVRAIDDNIRDLQHNFESFRVKSPISQVEADGTVLVPIGVKEGITKDSEYEVLEANEKNGRTVYKRIGVIAPIENRIMDNRYMAYEEGAVGSELQYTAFKVKSGATPMAGHLVRQIK